MKNPMISMESKIGYIKKIPTNQAMVSKKPVISTG